MVLIMADTHAHAHTYTQGHLHEHLKVKCVFLSGSGDEHSYHCMFILAHLD